MTTQEYVACFLFTCPVNGQATKRATALSPGSLLQGPTLQLLACWFTTSRVALFLLFCLLDCLPLGADPSLSSHLLLDRARAEVRMSGRQSQPGLGNDFIIPKA